MKLFSARDHSVHLGLRKESSGGAGEGRGEEAADIRRTRILEAAGFSIDSSVAKQSIDINSCPSKWRRNHVIGALVAKTVVVWEAGISGPSAGYKGTSVEN